MILKKFVIYSTQVIYTCFVQIKWDTTHTVVQKKWQFNMCSQILSAQSLLTKEN
mgnify:CR=1 FL=1